MKTTIIALSLALSATAGFAQEDVSPAEVCSQIARMSSINGPKCAQLIARNQYDQPSLKLALKALSLSTNSAVRILEITANGHLDPAAGEVCERVASMSTTNAVKCAEVAVNQNIANELARIAGVALQMGTTGAVGVLEAGANAYIYPPLANICEKIASVSTTNAIQCVKTIANKVTNNGAERVCEQAVLSQGSSTAIRCLQGIVMDYIPVPVPRTVSVEIYELEDLRRSMMKARALLNRNMIDQAQREMNEAVESVNRILLSPNNH